MTHRYTADKELRVLTLWQPWASLMAWSEKQCETRPRKWTHFGWVAIHAAAREPGMTGCEEITAAILRNGDPEFLPLGKILCVVRFACAWSTNAALGVALLSPRERAFGNYAPDRWIFETDSLQVLREPIPHKGGQGLGIAPLELRKQIAEALK